MKKLILFIAMLVGSNVHAQFKHHSDVQVNGHLNVNEYVEAPEGRFDTIVLGGNGTIGIDTLENGNPAMSFSGGNILISDPNAKLVVGKTDLSRSEYDPYSYGAHNDGLSDVTSFFNSRCPGGDCGVVLHPTKGIYRIDGLVDFPSGSVLKVDPETMFTGYGEFHGNNTVIEAGNYQWTDTTIAFTGTWLVEWKPVWFGGNMFNQETINTQVDSIMNVLVGSEYLSDYKNIIHKGNSWFENPIIVGEVSPYTLPSEDGEVNQSFFSDGNGALSWRLPGVTSNGLLFGNTALESNASIVLATSRELSPWSIYGSDYSGATDNVALSIDGFGYGGNGSPVMGDENVLIGKWTGYDLVAGGVNIYIGKSAGERNAAGYNNISLGENSGTRETGHYNVDIGYKAGYNYDCPGPEQKNVNIGQYAGFSYQDASNSWATTNAINIGEGAGYYSDQDSSINIGYYAGNESNFDAYTRNINIGHRAGELLEGNWNVNLGSFAGASSVGDSNVFIGNEVGYQYTGSNAVILDGMYRVPGDYLFKGNSLTRDIDMNSSTFQINAANFDLTNPTGSNRISFSLNDLSMGFPSSWEFNVNPNNASIVHPNVTYLGDMNGVHSGTNIIVDSNTGTIELNNATVLMNGSVNIGYFLSLQPLPSPPSNPYMGMIYCSTSGSLYFFNGGEWIQLNN